MVKSIEEKRKLPWMMPWEKVNPINIQGREYTGGFNLMRLKFEKQVKGYDKNIWGTYNQIKKLGGYVKKGEKSVKVTFSCPVYRNDKKDDWQSTNKMKEKEAIKKGYKIVMILKCFSVFNIDQTEGVKLPKKVEESQEKEDIGVKSLDEIDHFIENFENSPEIISGEYDACYVPFTHKVYMPSLNLFQKKICDKLGDKDKILPFYYGTLFHEIVHSTGHKSIFGRDTIYTYNDSIRSRSF